MDWGSMTQEEREAWRANRDREIAEKRARRAPKRQRRAEVHEVGEQFAAADDPPETAEPSPEFDLEPDDFEDEGDDAEMLRDAPIAVVPVEEEPVLDRATLLAGLDEKTRALLTDEDIEEILEEERKRAAEEQKKAAKTKARDQIRHRMRVEHGLLDAATLRTRDEHHRLAHKVRIRFDLPGEGAGHNGRNGIRINGHLYETRQWHLVTVAELESIREMHYNAWVNEVQFKTLDQASRFGITTMGRMMGTTPARAIFSQQPNQIEIQDDDA